MHDRNHGFATALAWGAAAGAAGTTALNAVTYLDMVWRGRPASSTPEESVERLDARSPVHIPGDGEAREHRVAGLGPLLGIAAGVGTGVVLGLARAAGWRPPAPIAIAAATAVALVAGNGPMTVLGVTDPRTWGASDWMSDVVPHVAYGAVTGSILAAST
jgi:hypothetical protein